MVKISELIFIFRTLKID